MKLTDQFAALVIEEPWVLAKIGVRVASVRLTYAQDGAARAAATPRDVLRACRLHHEFADGEFAVQIAPESRADLSRALDELDAAGAAGDVRLLGVTRPAQAVPTACEPARPTVIGRDADGRPVYAA